MRLRIEEGRRHRQAVSVKAARALGAQMLSMTMPFSTKVS